MPKTFWVNEYVDDNRTVVGYSTTNTLIRVVETLLDKRGGYLTNDKFPPGLWLDNMPNWEYGALVQVRDLSRAAWKAGYMADLLEVMQNRHYILEGGRHSGSGSADRAEEPLQRGRVLRIDHEVLETGFIDQRIEILIHIATEIGRVVRINACVQTETQHLPDRVVGHFSDDCQAEV